MKAYTKHYHCRLYSSWEIIFGGEVTVDAKVDGLTNGQTEGRTYGRKTGSLNHAMLKAGATKMVHTTERKIICGNLSTKMVHTMEE